MRRGRTVWYLDEVGLCGLLQGEDGSALEAEISLEVLGNLAHQALEGQLADQELGALLVAADLAEGDGAGPGAVGFLDAARGRGALAGGLLISGEDGGVRGGGAKARRKARRRGRRKRGRTAWTRGRQ